MYYCFQFAGVLLMVLIAPWFYKIWVRESVKVDSVLTIGMAVYIIVQSIAAIYMYLINGIGKIRIQLIIYLIFAAIAWPLMLLCCRALGLIGILIAPTIVYLVQAIFGKLQIEKLLSRHCHGLWNE